MNLHPHLKIIVCSLIVICIIITGCRQQKTGVKEERDNGTSSQLTEQTATQEPQSVTSSEYPLSEDDKGIIEEITNAIREREWEKIKFLLNKYGQSDIFIEDSSKAGANLLHQAIMENAPDDVIIAFTRLKSNFLHTNESGLNPLDKAILWDKYRIVQLLLDKIEHVNPGNYISFLGVPILSLAVQSENKEMVTLFLEKGAKMNIRDNYGQTPLYFSSLYGLYEITELLLSHYQEGNIEEYINIPDNYDDTPLIKAVQTGDEKLVTLLLSSGADPGWIGRAGRTAYFYAKKLRHEKIAGLLVEKMKKPMEYYEQKLITIPVRENSTLYRRHLPSNENLSGKSMYDLHRFKKNGLYGYIDRNGKVIFPAQFEEATHFVDHCALVKQWERWGMIDSKGEFVIQPVYDRIYTPKFGLIRIEKDDKFGFVNTEGKVVIQVKYPVENSGYKQTFSEGLCRFIEGHNTGFIDTRGDVVIPPHFGYHSNSFSYGMAYVAVSNTIHGYIDYTGNFIITLPPQWYGRAFNEKFAYYSNNNKKGIISREGKIYFEHQLLDPPEYSEGIGLIDLGNHWEDHKFYFINETFTIFTPPFKAAYPFSEGLARVSSNAEWIGQMHGYDIKGKWGYINKDGTTVIPEIYNEAENFRNGVARVHIKGKWGIIDKSGSFVFDPVYDALGELNEDRLTIQIKDKMGVVNKKGQFQIEPVYEALGFYSDNLYPAKKGGKYGFLDKNGIVKIDFQFENVKPFHNGLSRVFKILRIETGEFMYPYRYEEELLGFVNKGGHYFSLDTLTSKSIVITRIIYSSYIDYKNMYLPQNSFDGKPETAWLEKSEGSGIGEYIGFEAADRITADKIEILPGYFDKKWYADNNRVKHLTVELDDTEFDFSCQDKMQAHVFPLDGEKTFKNARFIVKEVYKSPKWDDTAIAEISFYYKGKKLEYDLGKVNN